MNGLYVECPAQPPHCHARVNSGDNTKWKSWFNNTNTNTNSNSKMADDSDHEDSFQDASENIPVATEMDLVTAIDEVNVALHLFLNNKHKEALERVKPWADRSIHHALGSGSLHFIQAFMTFEIADIELALDVLRKSADLCHRRRRKGAINSVTKMVYKPNYNAYAEEEVHAELCYAECLLMRALLTFVQDDNFVSFIKGGLRIRSCYQSYKECAGMLESRNFSNDNLKKHFESGVCMGIGTFNLLISTLPPRVLKLLEFVGFSGNRDIGNEKLHQGQLMQKSLRGPLCSLIVIMYHVIIKYALGKGSPDLEYVGQVLEPLIKSYPNSTLVQFCVGRYETTRGNHAKAVQWLEKSISAEVEWEKFKHLSHWEMAWNLMLDGNWKKAIDSIDILYRDNKWSKATYLYMKAASLIMSDDKTSGTQQQIVEYMKKVPDLKIRISGKSIPLEKFFCKKADKFAAQGNWILCPVYEMMYVWNYFITLHGKNAILDKILVKVDRALEELKSRKDWEYYGDNYCLALFIKGLCLRYMNTPLSAEECFKEVLQNQKSLKDDTYLTACAAMELGFIATDTRNIPLAIQYLEAARNEKAFFMEFRVHQGFAEIEAITKKTPQKNPKEKQQSSSSFRSLADADSANNDDTRL